MGWELGYAYEKVAIVSIQTAGIVEVRCYVGAGLGCPPRSVIPAVCYLIESVRLGWNLGLALENMAIKRIYIDWILSTKYIDRGSLPKSGVIIYLLRSVYILFSPNEL